MDLIYIVGIVSILGAIIGATLFFSSSSFLARATRASAKTEALNNLRQIGVALADFEMDYGSFPSVATIADVKARTSSPLTLDDSSSNKLFRQLLASGTGSEKPFYAKAPGARKPDNVFDSDATALEKGECAFAYVAGLNSSHNSNLLVVMTPMARGTRSFYRSKPLEKRAIALRLDNSATVFDILPDGTAVFFGGGNRPLFDPSLWGKVKPDLRWPE